MDDVVNLLPDRIPVLVVDDDETVIQVTRLVLSRYRFEDKALDLICACSAQEAIKILSQRGDIAIVLLDVVMESDDSGFEVVSFIRNNQHNYTTRILLRTGQPGLAPERQVINEYDINDYIAKTEATTDRLNLSITNALRSYRDILRAEHLARRVVTAELKQQQALKASKAKSAFLAHMSHEIRTPLNGIIGMTDVLADTDLTADQQAFLEDIHNSGRALLGIVNDVLDLSKIEAGKLELDPRPFRLMDMLAEVNSMFHASMLSKSINFYQEISPVVPEYLIADRIRLQQLVMNLLGNALKFTPEGGDIRLLLSVDEERSDKQDLSLILTISDSGIGIDESRLGQIFDAYQQAETRTSRIYGGTGLGLSLCRQIVQLMSGDIFVTSSLGKGSVFIANIVVKRAQGEKELDYESSTSRLAIEGMKVLVAEDNPINRRVIEMLLKKLSVEVSVVDDGLQLLNCIDEINPDLILMDCHMPVLDGFAATKELRKRGMKKPIYALTAGVSNEERAECKNIGMNDILTKPVTLQSLKLALQKATEA
ncbi:MAG: response regulator [Oleispira sp.]|nr:response regulator [Oleispira sp.]